MSHEAVNGGSITSHLEHGPLQALGGLLSGGRATLHELGRERGGGVRGRNIWRDGSQRLALHSGLDPHAF